MERETLYVVGPGTTTRRIMALMGLESTLLGVDVILDGRVLALAVAERDRVRLCRGRTTTQRCPPERPKSVVPTTMKTANIAPIMARFAGALETSARTLAGWKP